MENELHAWAYDNPPIVRLCLTSIWQQEVVGPLSRGNLEITGLAHQPVPKADWIWHPSTVHCVATRIWLHPFGALAWLIWNIHSQTGWPRLSQITPLAAKTCPWPQAMWYISCSQTNWLHGPWAGSGSCASTSALFEVASPGKTSALFFELKIFLRIWYFKFIIWNYGPAQSILIFCFRLL